MVAVKDVKVQMKALRKSKKGKDVKEKGDTLIESGKNIGKKN